MTEKPSASVIMRSPGRIRRFFDGWKRLEKAMDYTPYDYVLDRLNMLDARVKELEIRQSSGPPATTATDVVPSELA